MRAPNSDPKGGVLDDLALGRGGRLFNRNPQVVTDVTAGGEINTCAPVVEACVIYKSFTDKAGWGRGDRNQSKQSRTSNQVVASNNT